MPHTKQPVELIYQPAYGGESQKPEMELCFSLKGKAESLCDTQLMIRQYLQSLFPQSRVAALQIKADGAARLKCFIRINGVEDFFDKLLQFLSKFSDYMELPLISLQQMLSELCEHDIISFSQEGVIKKKLTKALYGQAVKSSMAQMAIRLATVSAQKGETKAVTWILEAKRHFDCEAKSEKAIAHCFESPFLQSLLNQLTQVVIADLSEWKGGTWLFEHIAACQSITSLTVHDVSLADADTLRVFAEFLQSAPYLSKLVYQPIRRGDVLNVAEALRVYDVLPSHMSLEFKGITQVNIGRLSDLSKHRSFLDALADCENLDALKVSEWSEIDAVTSAAVSNFLATSRSIKRVVYRAQGSDGVIKPQDIAWLAQAMSTNCSIESIVLSSGRYSDPSNLALEALMKQVRLNPNSAFKGLKFNGDGDAAHYHQVSQAMLWQQPLAQQVHQQLVCDDASNILII